MRSVRNQSFEGAEHIIVDGGSSDGTIGVLRHQETATTRWISEPDGGIAEAMNKGIAMAKGEWLLFLQSDDHLVSTDALQVVEQTLNRNVGINAYPVTIEDGATRRVWHPKKVRPRYLWKTPFPHQGTVIKRDLFNTVGLYDTSFRIAMDYDWFVRALDHGVAYQIHRFPLSVMDAGGISGRQDWQSLKTRFLEEKAVHYKNCRSRRLALFYKFYWLLYSPYRRARFELAQRMSSK